MYLLQFLSSCTSGELIEFQKVALLLKASAQRRWWSCRFVTVKSGMLTQDSGLVPQAHIATMSTWAHYHPISILYEWSYSLVFVSSHENSDISTGYIDEASLCLTFSPFSSTWIGLRSKSDNFHWAIAVPCESGMMAGRSSSRLWVQKSGELSFEWASREKISGIQLSCLIIQGCGSVSVAIQLYPVPFRICATSSCVEICEGKVRILLVKPSVR